MMTPQDHIREAENCLEVSEYLDGQGMRLLSSELIWLAAKYSVNAVALQRGLPHGTYLHKASALRTIASGLPQGPDLINAFNTARKNIHPNSDKDFIAPDALAEDCNQVRAFVAEMLAIARAALP